MGRLRSETISTLILWGLEDRDNFVAMAPISAVMMNKVRQNDSKFRPDNSGNDLSPSPHRQLFPFPVKRAASLAARRIAFDL